jgi:hypothetical protein
MEEKPQFNDILLYSTPNGTVKVEVLPWNSLSLYQKQGDKHVVISKK